MAKKLSKKKRIYISRDDRMDSIGVPINPHPYAPETKSQSLIRSFGAPQIIAILIVLIALLAYVLKKLLVS